MFRPFALFAAVFCGRERFKAEFGHVIAFWVLFLVFAATSWLAFEIACKCSGVKGFLILCSNAFGFSVSFLVLGVLADHIKDGAKGRADAQRRRFGRTMGRMGWVPFCGYASDDDSQTRYEPFACFLVAVVALLCMNIFAWILLVGSIALALYERAEEKRRFKAAETTLADLQARLRATYEALHEALPRIKEILAECHTVSVIEPGETPIAHRLDTLIQNLRNDYPNLFEYHGGSSLSPGVPRPWDVVAQGEAVERQLLRARKRSDANCDDEARASG